MNHPVVSKRKFTLHGLLAAALFILVQATPAQEQAEALTVTQEPRIPVHLERLSHDQLKAVYLGCSSAALKRSLAQGHVAYCSMVYEALKRRVFGGDFEALIAWSNANRSE